MLEPCCRRALVAVTSTTYSPGASGASATSASATRSCRLSSSRSLSVTGTAIGWPARLSSRAATVAPAVTSGVSTTNRSVRRKRGSAVGRNSRPVPGPRRDAVAPIAQQRRRRRAR